MMKPLALMGNPWNKKVSFSDIVATKAFSANSKDDKNRLINRLSKLSPQERTLGTSPWTSLGTVRTPPKRVVLIEQDVQQDAEVADCWDDDVDLPLTPLPVTSTRRPLFGLEDVLPPLPADHDLTESRTRPVNEECVLAKVSEKHLKQIRRLQDDGKIQTDLVLKTLLAIDFEFFYSPVSTAWMSDTVNILERSLNTLMNGSHVLLLISNIYIAACLSLMVGPRGSVVTFGVKQNIKAIKSCGLSDLLTSQRLIIVTANERNTGLTGQDFETFGYIEQSPYDLILMKSSCESNRVRDILQLQLKDKCGQIFDPFKQVKLYENKVDTNLLIYDLPSHHLSSFNYIF